MTHSFLGKRDWKKFNNLCLSVKRIFFSMFVVAVISVGISCKKVERINPKDNMVKKSPSFPPLSQDLKIDVIYTANDPSTNSWGVWTRKDGKDIQILKEKNGRRASRYPISPAYIINENGADWLYYLQLYNRYNLQYDGYDGHEGGHIWNNRIVKILFTDIDRGCIIPAELDFITSPYEDWSEISRSPTGKLIAVGGIFIDQHLPKLQNGRYDTSSIHKYKYKDTHPFEWKPDSSNFYLRGIFLGGIKEENLILNAIGRSPTFSSDESILYTINGNDGCVYKQDLHKVGSKPEIFLMNIGYGNIVRANDKTYGGTYYGFDDIAYINNGAYKDRLLAVTPAYNAKTQKHQNQLLLINLNEITSEQLTTDDLSKQGLAVSLDGRYASFAVTYKVLIFDLLERKYVERR